MNSPSLPQTANEYRRRTAATTKRRNQSASHKRGQELRRQLHAYAAALTEAKKNGTPLPHISDYTDSL